MTAEEHRPSEPQQKKVRAYFVKSNLYRVIHADGAWGGVSPSGHIRLGVYNEHVADPKEMLYELTGGRPQEIGRVPEDGDPIEITRQIEADIILTLATARSLHTWLGDKIIELEKAVTESSNGPITGNGKDT